MIGRNIAAFRQRGVALITAVLIVALAVILATQIGFDSTLEQRRSETVLTMDQAFLVGMGAEAWAASYLKSDADDDKKNNSPRDHLGETWATPIPPIPIDDGQIEGQLEDLQGRFNLNSLVDKNGDKDELAMLEFRRLLELLGLEPKWASLIVDWIDRNNQPEIPDGAEDNVYSAQIPPYRPPNKLITNTSELLALPDFGHERYLKLAPHVTALPQDAKLNVCTASGFVLDAMSATRSNPEGQTTFSIDAKTLEKNRSGKCFPQITAQQDEFEPSVADKDYYTQNIKPRFIEQSQYFRLTTLVTIGTTEFTLYSLLHRDPGTGQVRPVMRSFGTD